MRLDLLAIENSGPSEESLTLHGPVERSLFLWMAAFGMVVLAVAEFPIQTGNIG
jgi:hypothetical protein